MGQCCGTESKRGAGDSNPIEYLSKNRSCTDLPCYILFIVFVLAFILLSLWSFAVGDFRKVIYPTDSNGKLCGQAVPGKRYLYFFDLTKCFISAHQSIFIGCPTPQVCVEKCPEDYWSWKSPSPRRDQMICIDGKNGLDPDFAALSVETLVKSQKCAPYVFKSKSVFGRCLPAQLTQSTLNKSIVAFKTSTGQEIMLEDDESKPVETQSVVGGRDFILRVTGFFDKIFGDLSAAWHVILVGLLVAVVLSTLWILVMRYFAGVMVWCSLFLFFLLFSTASGFSFYRWYTLKNAEQIFPDDLEFDVSLYFRFATLWLVFGIILAIVVVIFTLCIIFLHSRIRIAIGLINITGKALIHMTSLLFWPILPLIFELALIVLLLIVSMNLRSISDPVGTTLTTEVEDQTIASQDLQTIVRSFNCNPLEESSAGEACRFLYYGDRKYTIYLQLFNVFMFFWITNFIRAVTETSLAGAFARFYYSQRDPSLLSCCPILPSLFQAMWFHGGTLAFGSLILALVQWIRVVFEYLESKLNHLNNPVARGLVCCCSCFLWCLEKFLRFLNRNAFIWVAIHGDNFCTSARKVFGLISRNLIRVFVVNKVCAFLFFIGKMVIVAACGTLAYVFLDASIVNNSFVSQFRPTLHYIFVPIVPIVIGAFIIACLFFNVFDMGVDTMFLCLLEDLERNDGSTDRPYVMSDRLLKIVGKKNQPVKTEQHEME